MRKKRKKRKKGGCPILKTIRSTPENMRGKREAKRKERVVRKK